MQPTIYTFLIVCPLVFLAGEYGWGESEYGWGEGYYTAMFDWDSYYANMGGGNDPWGPMAATKEYDEDKYLWYIGRIDDVIKYMRKYCK